MDEKLKSKIMGRIMSTQREGVDKLAKFLLYDSDYFSAPASSKYHSNYDGGLARHSDNLVEMLLQSNKRCRLGLTEATIYLAGYLHDLCKVNIYKKTMRKRMNPVTGNWEAYGTYEINDKFPLGHGEKSLVLALRFIQLTDEECLMIRWHMGSMLPLEDQKTLAAAQDKYPAVRAINLADIEASKFLERTIPPKVYTIDQYNRFVKGEFSI